MKISDALNVTSSALWKQGVFDSYIGIDSQLHIDPALLRKTRIPELKGAIKSFSTYFDAVLVLATQAEPGGSLEKQAIKRLIFPEISIAALGYAQHSNSGRGVTAVLAKQLYHTAKEVIQAGIRDPAIFELAIIFEEGFGPDLISDMTLVVILTHIESFNRRVCSKLGIPMKDVFLSKIGRKIAAAHSVKNDESILLIPYSILSNLPQATCRTDIDRVVAYNATVRESVNMLLGKNWSNLAKHFTKTDLRKLFLQNPEILKDLLGVYKKTQAQPYDFISDPLGEVIWESLGLDAAKSVPLSLKCPTSQNELTEVVMKIIRHFKKLVEINGHADLLYDDKGRQRHEKFAQLLFFAIADAYCKANNLDLSREPNAGRGPVDFKLSQGQARCLVEIKLSSNSKALDGLTTQLPEYGKAENANSKILLLVVVGQNVNKVNRIKKIHSTLKRNSTHFPHLVVVEAYDAYHRPSASKLI